MRTAIVLGVLASVASAQRTSLVDVALNGATPEEGAHSVAIGSTGRYVGFVSRSPMVANDANGTEDVFVRDMQTGQYELISVSTSGAQALNPSLHPYLSADARFVVFDGAGKNLVSPPDTFDIFDVFLRDRVLGTTVKVSVAPGGGEANGGSYTGRVSDDGRLVAFVSTASNLVAGDVNGFQDVFVRDVVSGTTTLVSTAGAPANGHSSEPAISGDGKFVAFTSQASNLVPGDTYNQNDVFVANLLTGAIVRASVNSAGAQADDDSGSPALSVDGHFVAFQSLATNLATSTNVSPDIYVRDMTSGITTRVSQSAAGVEANGDSFYPSISSDGRYVAFLTLASDLIAQPSLPPYSIVRVDRSNGQVAAMSVSGCGVPLSSNNPLLSRDGSAVAFLTRAVYAATNDVNDTDDVFVRDLALAPGPNPCSYCKVAPTSHGCLPAISSSGTPSASAGSGFLVSVGSVDGQRSGLFVFAPGAVTTPWGFTGPSFRCVGPVMGRSQVQSSGGTTNQCDGTLSIDANASWPSWVQAGTNAFLQGWFRDPASAKGSHFSSALAVVVAP